MRLTATRHPGIELMDLSKEGLDTLRNFWSSEGAEEKRKILMDAPQSYALMACFGTHLPATLRSAQEPRSQGSPDLSEHFGS